MAIGTAILGSGIFAREAHVPAVRTCADLQLLAVYSRSLKSAQGVGAGDGVDLYSEDSEPGKGLDDLLAREDVKAVIIGLPIPAQGEFIKKALKAGKHVLSEKPIAPTVQDARELIEWYEKEIDTSKVTWGVAENMRFSETFEYGAEMTKGLGRLLQFQIRVHKYTKDDGKYYNTSWRKTPQYQGGFLLDGGIHYVAGLRLLLGNDPANGIKGVSARTAQLQPHLPPIDTVNAVLQTKGGVSGTFSVSFGTMFDEQTWQLAFEKGSVVVSPPRVEMVRGRGTEPEERLKKSYLDEDDVKAEVFAWAKGLEAGKLHWKQTPQEGLADLVLLEAMFKSGEEDGKTLSL